MASAPAASTPPALTSASSAGVCPSPGQAERAKDAAVQRRRRGQSDAGEDHREPRGAAMTARHGDVRGGVADQAEREERARADLARE
jgi:hypothetical protein